MEETSHRLACADLSRYTESSILGYKETSDLLLLTRPLLQGRLGLLVLALGLQEREEAESFTGKFLLHLITTVLADINTYDPILAARKKNSRESDGFEPLEAYFNSENEETSKS